MSDEQAGAPRVRPSSARVPCIAVSASTHPYMARARLAVGFLIPEPAAGFCVSQAPMKRPRTA